MPQVQKPEIGRIIRHVTQEGVIVAGVVTAVMGESTINLHLFRDGVNQEYLAPHAYTVEYHPVAPDGQVALNTWHWPARS